MANIRLVDVSMRDGNQSLWGATGVDTAQALEIAPVVDRVGFKALDFTSSTHMSVAVRYHRENPWEKIRLVHRAMPNTPLQLITTGFRFISWEIADPEFMRLAYRRLVIAGVTRFIILDPMHDADALLAAAKIVREEGGTDIMGALTYTVSAVHDDAFYANLAARLSQSPNIDRLYIKDPAGILTPERARTLIPAVKGAMGDMPLELHSHCTIGLAPMTYMLAANLGVEVLHIAAGALANGTSLPSGQRVVANLREHGHTVDIDDDALGRMSRYFSEMAEAEGLPVGAPQDYDASFLRHQVAGGVMTTTKRQLEELGLGDRFPDVMLEIDRVRAELGYPIMVTPFPQIVCTQAMFNVINGERYKTVPDQVIRYVIERFGRPTAPLDPDIKDRILSLPRTKELLAEPPPPTLAELRKRFSPNISDEEFLLRAVMPAEQVDAMLAAGPAPRRYNARLRPVVKLLGEVAKRRDADRLIVEKPGFRLDLRRHPAQHKASA